MIVSKNGVSEDGKLFLTTNLMKMTRFEDLNYPSMNDIELTSYLEKIKENIQKCIDYINQNDN